MTNLQTKEGKYAALRFQQLISEDPEHALERQNMLIDTDPRHVRGISLEELPLPGVDGPRSVKARKDKLNSPNERGEEKETVSYISRDPAQIAQEEALAHERILYEMRQNLLKLKEFGKAAGFAFDVSICQILAVRPQMLPCPFGCRCTAHSHSLSSALAAP